MFPDKSPNPVHSPDHFRWWGFAMAPLGISGLIFANLTWLRAFSGSFCFLLGMAFILRAYKADLFLTPCREDVSWDKDLLVKKPVPPQTRWGRWIFSVFLILLLSGAASYFHYRVFDGQKSQSVISAALIKQMIDEGFKERLNVPNATPNEPGKSSQANNNRPIRRPETNGNEPRVEIREWQPIPSSPSGPDKIISDAPHVNSGSGVAYDEVETYKGAVLKSAGRQTEDALFAFLYSHENDEDASRKDQAPGEENILNSTMVINITDQDRQNYLNGSGNLYVGIVITYFDESHRKFRTESCCYMESATRSFATCLGHNRFYRVPR